MSAMPPLRIALLAHSTNPRGGVVHALELGDALTRLGHAVTVHAPDPKRAGFFRATLCRTVALAVAPTGADVTDMVETRIRDYVGYFRDPEHRRFDVFHAQDGISGNALATLQERGLIRRFVRTVHHVDSFRNARLAALQDRSIRAADRLCVVSRAWQDHLRSHFGRAADIVGDGVDGACFSPLPDGREVGLRRRLGLADGPVFLAIGGIEARKNTIRILEAFAQVQQVRPEAQLVIAGGASLFDHHDYQVRFAEVLAASGLPDGTVVLPGPMPQIDMPALYRIADMLVFPSLREGFGLVVLEAMASGVPVVISTIAPFTEYLGPQDVAWCDPHSASSIANAMVAALAEPMRHRLIKRGRAVAAKRDWRRVADAHRPAYEAVCEVEHA